MIAAQKISAKYNVFGLKLSLLEAGFNVNSCLHVEPVSMRDYPALGFDLRDRDHAELSALLISFLFEL